MHLWIVGYLVYLPSFDIKRKYTPHVVQSVAKS